MMRVLCLDVEGGFGGSSRSLYESLHHIDRTQVIPEVWCARNGPIIDRYAALGISVRVMHAMPRVSALPTPSRNLAVFGRYCLRWIRGSAFRRALLDAARRVDLVHCNHESLFGIAAWLHRRAGCPITMHIRTNLWPGPFARLQTRIITKAVNALVYITENERNSFARHAGARPVPPGNVIHNIAEPTPNVPPHPLIPRDGRLVIACISNYSWGRGIDRLIDIAAALRALGRSDILFVVAGNVALSKSLPGELGRIAAKGGTLQDYAKARAVDDMLLFLGHVPEPEHVLAGADLLVKPTREHNPWGRDIIEALAAGKPVLSVGTYTTFVEDGITGVLQPEFDAALLARRIVDLADDRSLIARMGDAAQRRVGLLCAGRAQAAMLADFWCRAAAHHA